MIDTQRRALLKALGAGTVLGIGAVGTAAARGRKREGASASDTIYEIASVNEDLETLTAALEATGLDDVLDSDDDQYTVFAPTDAAFAGVDTSGLTTAQLTNVLLYHVTEGRRYAASVLNAPQLEMLNGERVAVDGVNLNGDQADITARNDIEASNGVVHVVDGVLLP